MKYTIKGKDTTELAKYQSYLYVHPKTQFLMLTNYCNLKCKHCGSNS